MEQPEARCAHNSEVAGSSPAPATKIEETIVINGCFLFILVNF